MGCSNYAYMIQLHRNISLLIRFHASLVSNPYRKLSERDSLKYSFSGGSTACDLSAVQLLLSAPAA